LPIIKFSVVADKGGKFRDNFLAHLDSSSALAELAQGVAL